MKKARLILNHGNAGSTDATQQDKGDVRAFLEHLTGPSRGLVHWLLPGVHHVILEPDNTLRFLRPDDEVGAGAHIATLSWNTNRFDIVATEGRAIWINRKRVQSATISHLDMIEFGETGPMSRFRYCEQSYPAHWSVEDILGDTIAYAKTSRKPLAPRMSRAMYLGGRRLVSQTTLFFRITVMVTLVAFAVLGYWLYQNDRRFEERLLLETQRVAAIAAALSQARTEALTSEDLTSLRAEVETQLLTTAERLTTLEARSEATARVIQASVRSVVFLQGAFGLRHVESGAFLRHMVDGNGNRLNTPFGQPWIDPAGTGDIAEFQTTGTGFLIEDTGLIATNRHVAMPWTSRGQADAFVQAGLEPEILSLIGFLPGQPGAKTVSISRVSEVDDLALLSFADFAAFDRGLSFASGQLQAGEEIVLIGYPTGLRALLAQAGSQFLKELEETGDAQFWTAAARLSEADLIWPLSSRGIVAHVGADTVLYDAETTMGGSGGPVLNTRGEVIAINTAVLPEFGGSNMGIPVSRLKALVSIEQTQ